MNLATGLISKGSARVLATGSKVLCTAFLADQNSSPPGFTVNLPIVKKLKQKGE
jgi:hypothetical protein